MINLLEDFLKPVADAVQQGVQSGSISPHVQARSWGKGWIRPEKWKNKELRRLWASAKKMAPTVVTTPEKTSQSIRYVMQALAEGNAYLQALQRGQGRVGEKKREALARDLQEMASGIYGLAAWANNGSPVTGYNPTRLRVELSGSEFGRGFEGAQTVAVYVLTVDGIRFDATGASFAEKAGTFAANVSGDLRDRYQEMVRAQDPTRQAWQKVSEKLTTRNLAGVGVLALGGILLLAFARSRA